MDVRLVSRGHVRYVVLELWCRLLSGSHAHARTQIDYRCLARHLSMNNTAHANIKQGAPSFFMLSYSFFAKLVALCSAPGLVSKLTTAQAMILAGAWNRCRTTFHAPPRGVCAPQPQRTVTCSSSLKGPLAKVCLPYTTSGGWRTRPSILIGRSSTVIPASSM